MNKLLGKIRKWFSPNSITITELPRRVPSVIVSGWSETGTLNPDDNVSGTSVVHPIRMSAGDTFEVNWYVRIEYDPERGLVMIKNGDGEVATLTQEDGYSSHHHLDINYERQPNE